MKFIEKRRSGGAGLARFHLSPPNSSSEARVGWRRFNKKKGRKLNLRRDLEADQYGLCSYSEIRPDLHGIYWHVEHVKPKSKYPPLTFDYRNLALSALSDKDLAVFNESAYFGGHHKKNEFDEAKFISCFDVHCEKFFLYRSDGRVVPKIELSDDDSERSKYTIDLLNLNSEYLVNKRRNWYEQLAGLIDENLDCAVTLEQLARSDLLPSEGRLMEFFSITRQLYGRVAERIMTELPAKASTESDISAIAVAE